MTDVVAIKKVVNDSGTTNPTKTCTNVNKLPEKCIASCTDTKSVTVSKS